MARKKTTRRKHNEGSICKRKDGLWCAVVNLGYNEEGKRERKYIYGHSEEEVSEKLNKLTKKALVLKKDTFTNSFCDLMKRWLMVFKKTEVTSRTFENVMRNYKLHIYPYLRNLSMVEIDTAVIKERLNEIKSTEVKRKVKQLLGQFFDYAVEQKLIEYNPVRVIKIKTKEKKDISEKKEEYKAIKPEYRETFLDALSKDSFLKTLCLVGYYSGLRIGEILALRWKDFDFNEKTIFVENAVSYDVEFDDNGKVVSRKTIVTDPKTGKSKALLPMSDILMDVLKDWQIEQKQKGKELKTNITTPNSYVFCKDDGTIRTYSGTHSIFYRFLKKNNLLNKGFHFHALRHTFATILKDNKVNIYGIQSLLRHSRVTTTERYLSSEPKDALRLKDELNDVFTLDEVEIQPNKEKDDFEM